MRELVFALAFRGTAGPVAGGGGTRRARTTAASQTLTTVFGADGIDVRVADVEGDRAVLESSVERFDDGSFVEDGTITYGQAGRVSFVTIGRGTVAPSPVPGWQRGAVIWLITAADGKLAGAQGIITSNFTVSAQGEVVDNHVTRLYLP
jgi:hypothetical protein